MGWAQPLRPASAPWEDVIPVHPRHIPSPLVDPLPPRGRLSFPAQTPDMVESQKKVSEYFYRLLAQQHAEREAEIRAFIMFLSVATGADDLTTLARCIHEPAIAIDNEMRIQ